MRQNTEKIIFVASNTHKYVAKGEDRNSVCCRAPHSRRRLAQNSKRTKYGGQNSVRNANPIENPRPKLFTCVFI